MSTAQEKVWYSVNEAAAYLNMAIPALLKKVNLLNVETRELPSEKGQFIHISDVLAIKHMVNGPKVTLPVFPQR